MSSATPSETVDSGLNGAWWRQGWQLLDPKERREAFWVLFIILLSAVMSAAMIASILPFLSVLADPVKVQSDPILSLLYRYGGFDSTYGFLVGLGMLSLSIIFLASGMQILRTFAVSRFSMMRVHSLSVKLLGMYLRQPYAYFLNKHTGEMSTLVLSECQQIVIYFFRPLANVIASIFSVIAITILLLFVNVWVTVISFSVLAILYGGIFVLSRRELARRGDERVEMNTARFRLANEAISGIKDIKLIGKEQAYHARFEQPSRDMAKSQVVSAVLGEVPSYVLQGLAFGGMIVFCLLLLNPEGTEDGNALSEILPLLGVFAFAGQRLIPELQRLYVGVTQLQFGKAAVSALYKEWIGANTDTGWPSNVATPMGLKKDLKLSSLCYTYPKAEATGLSDISITITAGERIGIVGTSGAGKSTLADILLGLLTPTSGSFNVDGVAIDAGNIHSWQRSVGYVPQDVFLVDASVAENVALGCELDKIDMDRVRVACRIAQIASFIETDLPGGYLAPVGERGVRMSGGQKQRIGIARALYYNADILVFDEATSALDTATEIEVMQAIKALPGDKTIILIAHRLSTVRDCDRIIVLDKGSVAGAGTWQELATSNPIFQTLVAARDTVSDTKNSSMDLHRTE